MNDTETEIAWTIVQQGVVREYILRAHLDGGPAFRAILWIAGIAFLGGGTVVASWARGEPLLPSGTVLSSLFCLMALGFGFFLLLLVLFVLDRNISLKKASWELQQMFRGDAFTEVLRQIEHARGCRRLGKPGDVSTQVWQAYDAAEHDFTVQSARRSFP